jgi:hypothetical protein
LPDTGYIAVFLVGLLGGTHCMAMCGGIVGALTVHLPAAGRSGRCTSPTTSAASPAMPSPARCWAPSAGRPAAQRALPVQMALYVLANLMLVALGLYLIGVPQGLTFLERGGQKVWARLQPLTRRFLPATSVARAYPLGPGVGIPALRHGVFRAVDDAAHRQRPARRRADAGLRPRHAAQPAAGRLSPQALPRRRAGAPVRLAAGLLVLGFGVWGLFNATSLGGRLWQGIVCAV